MRTYRLALIGFGNVGQGLVEILTTRRDELASRFGARFEIVAISDPAKGSCYDPGGLNLEDLLDEVNSTGGLTSIDAPHRGWDSLRTITDSNAEIVIEISYTNLETAEPALTHARTALRAGKHLVTTNKGPAALYFPELRALANEKNVQIGVEGTVMSGTPALQLGMEMLAGAGVNRIEGILNGTTNYILTQMENGDSYSQALTEAQEKGYAEADPSGDVEGHDAAGKLVILANLLMSLPLTVRDVECQGITQLAPEDIVAALKVNERWKLIGVVEKTKRGFNASVMPTRVAVHHPLSSISGVTNAITYTTDLLGKVTLVGPGAGRIETGYALIQDMLAIHRKGSP